VQSRGSVADRETARSIRSYTALSGQTTLRAVSATERPKRMTHTAQLSRPLSDMFKNRVINNSRTTSIVPVLLPAKRDIQYNLIHPDAASVHQRQRLGVKLVAALLRVARVTAGLAESNGSLPPGL